VLATLQPWHAEYFRPDQSLFFALCLQGDAKIAELLKENAIFKRAVQIQASRMQAKNGLEEEVASLRNALSQYQEQCRRLELHNYSLAMHLQQATSSSTTGGHFSHHPPDVF
jgi:hypothetical protein